MSSLTGWRSIMRMGQDATPRHLAAEHSQCGRGCLVSVYVLESKGSTCRQLTKRNQHEISYRE